MLCCTSAKRRSSKIEIREETMSDHSNPEKIRLAVALLVAATLLAGCGGESSGAETAAMIGAVAGECGNGGTECPAGLECVTFRGDTQACGPESRDAVVLIRDATLGGACLSPNPADPLPGASIATVQVIVAHLRGVDNCGEEVADEITSAVCNDPPAAASGDLSSCGSKIRMIEVREDLYGPDRVGGTIQYIAPPR